MAEFKFDHKDLDEQTIRIAIKMSAVLADENPAHVLATLTMEIASYVTLLSKMAEMEVEDVDRLIDGMTAKIRHATHIQRAHFEHLANPGNA